MARYTDRDYDDDWDYDQDWDYERRSDYVPGSYGRNRGANPPDYYGRSPRYGPADYSERTRPFRDDYSAYGRRFYDPGRDVYRRGNRPPDWGESYDRDRVDDWDYDDYNYFRDYRYWNEGPDYYPDRYYRHSVDRDYAYERDWDRNLWRRTQYEARSQFSADEDDRYQAEDRRERRFRWRPEFEPANVW